MNCNSFIARPMIFTKEAEALGDFYYKNAHVQWYLF